MPKFIEVTSQSMGAKYLINVNTIEIVGISKNRDCFISFLGDTSDTDNYITVAESYEQVKEMIENV